MATPIENQLFQESTFNDIFDGSLSFTDVTLKDGREYPLVQVSFEGTVKCFEDDELVNEFDLIFTLQPNERTKS